MAYARHEPFDTRNTDMVFVVWDFDVKDGRIQFVPAGQKVPQDGEIIFASCADTGSREEIEAEAAHHLHRWRVAHGTHLQALR